MRQLTESELFSVVFQDFDSRKGLLRAQSAACNGAAIFEAPEFESTRPRGGWPVAVREDSVAYGRGVNRMRVVWLKTHEAAPGKALAGPIALVRTVESFAEVYALGAYRGDPERSRFGVERMGTRLVVTAMDEGCQNRPQGATCESLLHVFAPMQGQLRRAAVTPLERVRYYSGGEPGAEGVVEYHLVATPTFEDRVVRLLEQVTATDSAGRELRRAERARLILMDGGQIQETDACLWDSVVPKAQEEAAGASTGDSDAKGLGAKDAPQNVAATKQGSGSPSEPGSAPASVPGGAPSPARAPDSSRSADPSTSGAEKSHDSAESVPSREPQ